MPAKLSKLSSYITGCIQGHQKGNEQNVSHYLQLQQKNKYKFLKNEGTL